MVSLSNVWFLTRCRKTQKRLESKHSTHQKNRKLEKSTNDSKKENEQKRTKWRQPIRFEYFDKLKSAISHTSFYFFSKMMNSL